MIRDGREFERAHSSSTNSRPESDEYDNIVIYGRFSDVSLEALNWLSRAKQTD